MNSGVANVKDVVSDVVYELDKPHASLPRFTLARNCSFILYTGI